MPSPMRDKHEGSSREGEGATPIKNGLSRRSLEVSVLRVELECKNDG